MSINHFYLLLKVQILHKALSVTQSISSRRSVADAGHPSWCDFEVESSVSVSQEKVLQSQPSSDHRCSLDFCRSDLAAIWVPFTPVAMLLIWHQERSTRGIKYWGIQIFQPWERLNFEGSEITEMFLFSHPHPASNQFSPPWWHCHSLWGRMYLLLLLGR